MCIVKTFLFFVKPSGRIRTYLGFIAAFVPTRLIHHLYLVTIVSGPKSDGKLSSELKAWVSLLIGTPVPVTTV